MGATESTVMIRAIYEAVEQDDFQLSEWESDFLSSINDRVRVGKDLTDAQDDKLTEIWKRAMRY